MRNSSRYLIAALVSITLLSLGSCNKQAEQESATSGNTSSAVEAAGFQTADIKVEGMHCDNCKQSIEGTVGKMAGVQSVNADFEKGQAIVSFDPSQTSTEAISREIESLGFTVPREDAASAEAAENDNSVTNGDETETNVSPEGNG